MNQTKIIWILAGLALWGSQAQAWLGPFMEEPGPAVVERSIVAQCGPRTTQIAMRAVFQFKSNWGQEGKEAVDEVALSSMDGDGPVLRMLSKRLAEHLKKKKNKVLNVVWIESGHSVMNHSQPTSLDPCLIDGKPIKYWFTQEKGA